MTAEDVSQAWADVEVARAAVAELKNKFVTGDDSVSQADIASQQGVVEWLELVAQRVEHQRTRYEAEFAVQARKALRAEILHEAGAVGVELLKQLEVMHKAAVEFEDLANAHDARVREWGARAKALGVPSRGQTSAAHEGMGVEAGGSVLVDDVRVPLINADRVLHHVFHATPYGGILPSRGESDVAVARRIVGSLGKAAV